MGLLGARKENQERFVDEKTVDGLDFRGRVGRGSIYYQEWLFSLFLHVNRSRNRGIIVLFDSKMYPTDSSILL